MLKKDADYDYYFNTTFTDFSEVLLFNPFSLGDYLNC